MLLVSLLLKWSDSFILFFKIIIILKPIHSVSTKFLLKFTFSVVQKVYIELKIR